MQKVDRVEQETNSRRKRRFYGYRYTLKKNKNIVDVVDEQPLDLGQPEQGDNSVIKLKCK